MSGLAALSRDAIYAADASLRAPPPPDPIAARPAPLWPLLPAVVLLAPLYGAAMGSYGLADPGRRDIALYAAIKAPMLMLVTMGVCLAPLLVLAHIARLPGTLRSALAAILSGQACAAAVLAAASPTTLMIYTGIRSHDHAILYNAGVFGLAALLGHRATLQRFRPLIAAHARGW